jgi:predicted nucleotidyltransferase component of viral defense system
VIGKQDILDRVREWGLRAETVEKDYVLGWLLAAVGQHPGAKEAWVFKGGTCLKKCYFETYRFSEDLDFSLLPGAAYTADALRQILIEVAARATELSGVTFPGDTISVRERKDARGRTTFEGKVGYSGPLAVPTIPRILFDITQHEPVLDEAASRPVFHPYPDKSEPPAQVAAYSLLELFSEKVRALFERTRPRDLYDVVYILENHAAAMDLDQARDLLRRKCNTKAIAAPSSAILLKTVREAGELRSEWENMLAHQLPQLPPLDGLLDRLEPLLAWVDAPVPAAAAPLAGLPVGAGEQAYAPAGVTVWNTAVPLESVRFAGANRLLVEFDYHGKHRLAEPYSIRRASTGNVLFYAWDRNASGMRAFKVQEIQNLRVTKETYVPRYAVELSPTQPLITPMAPRRASSVSWGSVVRTPARPRRPRRSKTYGGQTYVFQCGTCMKKFRRSKNDPILRKHKGMFGTCPGRRGYLLAIR